MKIKNYDLSVGVYKTHEWSSVICTSQVQNFIQIGRQIWKIEYKFIFTVMRRLTTGIRSEKCVVRPFRRCANVIECIYTNLDSTV